MRKQLISIMLCMGAVGAVSFCPTPAFAAVAQNQTIKVKGQVVDETGEPLVGATVKEGHCHWINNRFRWQLPVGR